MLCRHGKYHTLQPKQCKCSRASNGRLGYHESPRGSRSWYEPISPEASAEFMTGPNVSNENQCDCHENDSKIPFSEAFGRDYLAVIGLHAEGEPHDIVTGGIGLDDLPGDSIIEQQEELRDADWHRSLLLNEPRGRCGMNAAIILPPTCACTDKGVIFMKNDSLQPAHDSYPPVSVTGLICATKVVLEYQNKEKYPLGETLCPMIWNTVAGNVEVTGVVNTSAHASYCTLVSVENVPSFVLELDYQVDCPAIGTVTVDIAFGGVFCAFLDASSLGLQVDREDAQKMAEIGEQIKKAINASYTCSHPTIPFIKQTSSVVFTEPAFQEERNKVCLMATVVSPGRLDRSPSGTATSARLAILSKRGQIGKEFLRSVSVAGGQLFASVSGQTKLGLYDAILPHIFGRAWTTSVKQIGVEEGDPFPTGFCLDDSWGWRDPDDHIAEPVGLGMRFGGKDLRHFPDGNDVLGETY